MRQEINSTAGMPQWIADLWNSDNLEWSRAEDGGYYASADDNLRNKILLSKTESKFYVGFNAYGDSAAHIHYFTDSPHTPPLKILKRLDEVHESLHYIFKPFLEKAALYEAMAREQESIGNLLLALELAKAAQDLHPTHSRRVLVSDLKKKLCQKQRDDLNRKGFFKRSINIFRAVKIKDIKKFIYIGFRA